MTCSVCFEESQDKTWWTTVCGHPFCSTCGPIAFRNWTPNHNAGTTFVECPACRTVLSSFDVIRHSPDAKKFEPLDTFASALATEVSLVKRKNTCLTLALDGMSPQLDPELPWHEFMRTHHPHVTTLILTHIGALAVQPWSIQLLQWAAATKKNLKIVILRDAAHRPSMALKRILEIN